MKAINNSAVFKTGTTSWITSLEAQGIYVHALPGRLRVELPTIKHDPATASAITRAIQQIRGVNRVQASALTGRMLVEFDPSLVSHSMVIRRLTDNKCFAPAHPVAASSSQTPSSQTPSSQTLTSKAFSSQTGASRLASGKQRESSTVWPGLRVPVKQTMFRVIVESAARAAAEAMLGALLG